MRNIAFLLLFVLTTMRIQSQEKPLLLFPGGVPCETGTLKQVEDLSGNKVAGCIYISILPGDTVTGFATPPTW